MLPENQSASKFAGKLFQQGISDRHSRLEFSEILHEGTQNNSMYERFLGGDSGWVDTQKPNIREVRVSLSISHSLLHFLVDVPEIFFSARGGGRESLRRRTKAWSMFIENSRREGGRFPGAGAGRVSAANWGFFFGGG